MEKSECCHWCCVWGTWAPSEDPGRRRKEAGSCVEVRPAHLGISFFLKNAACPKEKVTPTKETLDINGKALLLLQC